MNLFLVEVLLMISLSLVIVYSILGVMIHLKENKMKNIELRAVKMKAKVIENLCSVLEKNVDVLKNHIDKKTIEEELKMLKNS